MSEALTKQMLLQCSIERALENFKKMGKANLTTAKIRTKIAAVKDSWINYQNGHVILLKLVPAASRASIDYFKEGYYESTEDTYQITWEYFNECLEELDPVVSHNQLFENSIVRSDATALSLSYLLQIKLLPFDGSYHEWENFRDQFIALIIRNKSVTDFARITSRQY